MSTCTDLCRDTNCPNGEDNGPHCHHDHRDPETKRVQNASVARTLRRMEAIEWLTDNIDELKNILHNHSAK